MQLQSHQLNTQVMGVKPLKMSRVSRSQKDSLQVVKSVGLRNIPESERPTLFMRRVYNAGYIGGLTAVAACYAIPFFVFFYPPMEGGAGSGAVAKDKIGKIISIAQFKKENQENRSLVQGIKGDPTYLIVKDNKVLDVGVQAVCTHLGCVVPWNKTAEQFQCPCHGSRYNFYGKVVRGPAPLSLPLVHVAIDGDIANISPWTETDFRTNEAPWWK